MMFSSGYAGWRVEVYGVHPGGDPVPVVFNGCSSFERE
jgi:hypothetical protein